jgi:hypothetical protein
MNTDKRAEILQQLAQAIARRRLTAPARLALDVLSPLSFLASQIALFLRPLTHSVAGMIMSPRWMISRDGKNYTAW